MMNIVHDDHSHVGALTEGGNHDVMVYKGSVARKGGVPADRVLNAMALPEITRYLRQKRRSPARAA